MTQLRRESGSRCAFTKDGTPRILTERRQRKTCNADSRAKTSRGAERPYLCRAPLLSQRTAAPLGGLSRGGGRTETCGVTARSAEEAGRTAVSVCHPPGGMMSQGPPLRTGGGLRGSGEGLGTETGVTVPGRGGVTSLGECVGTVPGGGKPPTQAPLWIDSRNNIGCLQSSWLR